MYKNLTINSKLLIIFLSALVFFAGLFFYSQKNYSTDVAALFNNRIKDAEATLEHLEKRDVNMLSALLKTISNDKTFKTALSRKDRKLLYKHGTELFKEFKKNYGIDHFDFHFPGGTNFARFHAEDFHGDHIKRATLEKARKSGKVVSAMEAGTTAFALRALTPVYEDKTLIGFIELGMNIDHFLEILKSSTGDDYALVVEKTHLDKDWWTLIRDRAGKTSNWNKMNSHVIIAQTSTSDLAQRCFTEENIDVIESKPSYIKNLKFLEAGLACGGFPLNSLFSTDEHIGELIVIMNLNKEVATLNRSNSIITASIFGSLLFIAIALIIIRKSIASPVGKLVKAAQKISEGEFTYQVRITSNSDISKIAIAMNEMGQRLKMYYEKMEEMVQEKTKEVVITNNALVSANSELREAYNTLENQTKDLELVNEELKGLERLKTEFLQTVSHELRSPLTPILGYLELMKDGDLGEFSKTQSDVIKEMFICGKNLQMVLDELLEAASIQAGRLFLDFIKIDLITLINDTIRDIKRYTDEVNMTITMTAPEPPLIIIGDDRKLHQIFTHIMRNAVKFNKKAGKIDIIVKNHIENVEIIITDTGIGIPEDKLEKIFEGFYQVDSSASRHHEGVGLGLFLVKKLIDTHYGEISVKSTEGKGTSVTVLLPKQQRTDSLN